MNGRPSLDHGSAHDTLRWGETQTLVVPVGFNGDVSPVPEGTTPPLVTKQMLAAHWRWPLSWVVTLIMQPAFNADETNTFYVQWQFTVGVGQAICTFYYLYTFAPTGGLYTAQNVQLFTPAQDLQVNAALACPSGAVSSKPESFNLAAFSAPVTEPHAMTHLLDKARGHAEEHVPWMPPGFNETDMGYRR